MSARSQRTRTHLPEIAIALLLLAVIALLVAPLPPFVLDIALAANLAAAIVILLVALSVSRPLSITSFPAILLITTLLRLGLNVSSTRLILGQAYAGEVIEAFASWVVAGSLVVGAVIFLILTVIQFVVIARGSERVAEVSARFALDAMPGRQMAIDADLRSGAITLEEARDARARLTQESRLYGAMDGAMKFVKGDAIAGLLILAIDLLGGLAIGTTTLGMSPAQALQTFGMLTIGDGLVSQIPALLLATSAGLIVTRVAATTPDADLGRDILDQLSRYPRALTLAAALLALFALLPGLPALPFALLAAGCAAAAFYAHRQPASSDTPAPHAFPAALTLELPDSIEPEAVETLLAHVRLDSGLSLDDLELRASSDPRARLFVDGFLSRTLEEPTLQDLEDALIQLLPSTLTLQQVHQLLTPWREREPLLLDALLPRHISLVKLTRVLRGLIADGFNIRQLRPILECALELPTDASVETLHDAARIALRNQSVERLQHDERALTVLGPRITRMLEQPPIAPSIAREILDVLRREVDAPDRAAFAIAARARRPLHTLLAPDYPDCPVLALEEVEHAPLPHAVVDVGR